MKKIVITVGLPASGKTTFSKQYQKENNVNSRYKMDNNNIVRHIEFDERIRYQFNKGKTKEESMKNAIDDTLLNKTDELVLDGLFLTNEDVIKVVKMVKCQLCKLEVHYWESDIEACLWNDQYRRSDNSSITIENAEVLDMDIQKIKDGTNINDVEIVKHIVKRKEDWRVFSDKNNICLDESNNITSSSWSLGGSWANCWGDSGSVSGDAQPSTFEELDSLFEEVCSSISFMQYKRIVNNCVSTDTYNNGDYYGGNVEYAYFKCNIIELYDMLIDMNLIEV